MTAAKILLAGVAVVLSASSSSARERPLRYGNTSGWSFDGRDDDRDFPTNGYFPGNFAADPFSATPWRWERRDDCAFRMACKSLRATSCNAKFTPGTSASRPLSSVCSIE